MTFEQFQSEAEVKVASLEAVSRQSSCRKTTMPANSVIAKRRDHSAAFGSISHIDSECPFVFFMEEIAQTWDRIPLYLGSSSHQRDPLSLENSRRRREEVVP